MSQPRAAAKLPEARLERLLHLLADGAAHSGEVLAKRLRVTRAAVWKMTQTLRERGVPIEAIARQGYRLPHAVDLYDAALIKKPWPQFVAAAITRLDVLLTVDSTNRHVVEHPAEQAGQGVLCVAEIQQAGRGRRGRSWLAPFGSGICMSLGWLFDTLPPAVSTLSLVVGVALTRVLRQLGVDIAATRDLGLKWPNDVIWRGRKLAGVLIEMRGEPDGPTHVVIGIGMNLRMPMAQRLNLAETQAVVVSDLHEIFGDKMPGRNALVSAFTAELVSCLQQFAQSGFAAFHDEWRSYDALAGAEVKVLTSDSVVLGIARGANAEGALQLEVDGRIQSFISGEVSLRAKLKT